MKMTEPQLKQHEQKTRLPYRKILYYNVTQQILSLIMMSLKTSLTLNTQLENYRERK